MTNRSQQSAGTGRFFYSLVSRLQFACVTMNEHKNLKVVVASDVSGGRDGIGVEISLDDEVVLEIFRDDTKRTREVTLFRQDVPLTVVEESIVIFKQEIPWDFIDDDGRIESHTPEPQ